MGQVSGSAEWSRPTSPVVSTRMYMAGAFVGALVLLACSLLAGWPVAAGGAAQADPAELAANAAVGDCLTWTRPDASDLTQVDCSASHVFEVTGSANVTAQFPAGAPLPSTTAFQQAAKSGCTAGATAYLGKLDPNGKYVVSALKPNSQQWAAGDRTLRCGLQSSTPTGQLLATTGTAKGQDQSAVYPVGTCLALVGKVPGGPVACSTLHSYEIVGLVDLKQRFPGTDYPAQAAQQTALGALCVPAANTYTHNANLPKYGLTLTWSTIGQDSWAAGSRKVDCEVGTPLPDGTGLEGVANSVKGVGG
jgi:Septum formation